MKKTLFFFGIIFLQNIITAQSILSSWTMNAVGFASYWQKTNDSKTCPSFVFYTSTALANVKKVCYYAMYVWTQSDGMTSEMGQFFKTCAPTAKGYTYGFPRNPTIPINKTILLKQGLNVVSLTASRYGLVVSTTYPLGTYNENYNWLASNCDDLNKYNLGFCITPEFPTGTYDYFVTVNARGTDQFPYYIGIEYYGSPETDDITFSTSITIPAIRTSCFTTTLGVEDGVKSEAIYSYPNHQRNI